MTEKDLSPKAFRQGQEEAQTKPDDITWGDWMLTEGKELSFRHETLAHMAASGMSNQNIAKDLGFTDGRVSVLLTNTRIRARIKEIQSKYWGDNITQRFKSAVPKAMDVIEETITDPLGKHKQQLKTDAAKWLLEKVTGKAKQEIDIKGNTIVELFARLDDSAAKKTVINVKPDGNSEDEHPNEEQAKLTAPKDKLNQWVDQNVPIYESTSAIIKKTSDAGEEE